MKQKKLKKLFYIIITLILPIVICADECINCDDQQSTCHQNCKKSLVNGDSNYYYCNLDDNQYYFIKLGPWIW